MPRGGIHVGLVRLSAQPDSPRGRRRSKLALASRIQGLYGADLRTGPSRGPPDGTAEIFGLDSGTLEVPLDLLETEWVTAVPIGNDRSSSASKK